MTNLLIALSNIAENPITDIANVYKSSNRANGMGDSLEAYVKDLFCGSTNIKDAQQRNEIYHKNFSYIGNQNNPPDVIIRGGDAIEVKKIESLRSGIALNSSYPKDKIYADSPMITAACRECEDWREKDLIYAVGVSKKNKLQALWFIYGNCYAANKSVYERIKGTISSGINNIEDVEFSDTKEFGRVNKVDPLGITYLRIRGMWGIENPIKVFEYVTSVKDKKELTVNALMLTEKYLSFPQSDREKLEEMDIISIDDVKIKSPNNPAQLLDAKLIKYER